MVQGGVHRTLNVLRCSFWVCFYYVMDSFISPQFITTVLGYVFGGGVLWGAIRMDIKNIHRSLQEHKEEFKEHRKAIDEKLKETNKRIDTVLFRHIPKDTSF